MKTAKQITEMLKANAITEAVRPLAAPSDRAKYAGLKKQVADLEKTKKEIHDQWAKEADDKKRGDLYTKLGQMNDKIAAIEKNRTAMMKKFRGLRVETK